MLIHRRGSMMRAAFQSDLCPEIEGPVISVKTRWWVWLAEAKAFCEPSFPREWHRCTGTLMRAHLPSRLILLSDIAPFSPI